MNKKIFFLVILLSAACKDVTNLEYYCKNQVACYLPEGFENIEKNIIFEDDLDKYGDRVQYCSLGKTICEDENVKCEGVVYTEQEQCDGTDNDCNGIVDDPELFHAGIANTKCYFEEVGECRYSEQYCINGELTCVHTTSPNFGEEMCDGKDNDCDGQYDEDIPTEFIYTGSIETAGIGECRIGYTDCEDGQTVIKGEVLPRNEICSNGKDDDCDGISDEMENGITATDYALLIDFSGSMLDERLDSVVAAVCHSPDNPLFALNRYAIIGISIAYASDDVYNLELISDFSDLLTACTTMATYNPTSGAEENQIDAIYRIFDLQTPIYLNWSDNSRKVYIFTDEPAQTAGGINTQSLIAGLEEHCIENDYELGLFLDLQFYANSWDRIPENCIDFIEDIDLLQNENYLDAYFLQWFGQEC